MLRTNIELDGKRADGSLKLTPMKTEKEFVNNALEEHVRKIKREKLLELGGFDIIESYTGLIVGIRPKD